MTLRDFHSWWAWVMIAGNGVTGAWALGAHRWERLRTRWLWVATAVAEVAVFVQVIAGVKMVAGRDLEDHQFHMFYGFVAIAAIGVIYSYRHQLRDRMYLLYGFGGLFVMGLGLRALQVGAR